MEKTKPIKVKDAMRSNVITVRSDTNIQEVARLMTEHHIRALPVVDDDNRVIGIITESDLFLKEKGMPFTAVKHPALFQKWVDPAHLADIYEGVTHHTASDVMTEDVITVSQDTTIGDTALLMFKNDLRTVPVVEDGKLVGIITRVDFIRMLAGVE